MPMPDKETMRGLLLLDLQRAEAALLEALQREESPEAVVVVQAWQEQQLRAQLALALADAEWEREEAAQAAQRRKRKRTA